jgi:hypothetical protein
MCNLIHAEQAPERSERAAALSEVHSELSTLFLETLFSDQRESFLD